MTNDEITYIIVQKRCINKLTLKTNYASNKVCQSKYPTHMNKLAVRDNYE